MEALALMYEGPRPEVQMLRDFAWIDLHGVDGATAEVEYCLETGQLMTMAAGGTGIHAFPDRPPYCSYEVLFDADPPHFWERYTDSVGLVYAHVPRMLLTHYVVRNGGIQWRRERIIESKKKAMPFYPAGGCIRW